MQATGWNVVLGEKRWREGEEREGGEGGKRGREKRGKEKREFVCMYIFSVCRRRKMI